MPIPEVGGEPTALISADRLIDADGHVNEDQPAIMARLSDVYRPLSEAQFSNTRSLSQLGGLFPSLGHLSNIPLRTMALENRKPEEHGEDPESWVYFLDAVGIEKTVLYPTAGLTISRVRDRHYFRCRSPRPLSPSFVGSSTSGSAQPFSQRKRLRRRRLPRLQRLDPRDLH
jgi:hypothetical protein